jgi:hypothetical protein
MSEAEMMHCIYLFFFLDINGFSKFTCARSGVDENVKGNSV